MELTSKRAACVGLLYIVVFHREGLTEGRRLDNLPAREDTQEVGDDRHWATCGEVGCSKNTTQVLVLLGVKLLLEHTHLIKINEPQLPWLQTAIYHTQA